MPVKFFNTLINKIFKGTTEINKIYFGDNLIFDSAPPPAPPPTFTPPTPNFTPDFVPPQPNFVPDFVPNFVPDFVPNFVPDFVPNFVPNFTPPPPPTQVIARYFYLGSEWDSKFVDSGTAPGNPPRGNPPVAGTWAPSVNDPITVNTDYFWLDDSPPPPTFTPPPPTFTPPTPNFTPPTPNFTPPTPNFTPPTPNFTPPTPNFTPPPPPPYFSPFG
jgi:hypothetical protein